MFARPGRDNGTERGILSHTAKFFPVYISSSHVVIKRAETTFADKDPCSQNYGFSSYHIWMSELDHKEGWAPKNWCFWAMVLESTHESPLDRKPVHPKRNHPCVFIGRTDAEAPERWPPDAESQLTGKDPDVGKDWRQEKRVIEEEMVGQHHWCSGHAFKQTLGDS